MNNLYELIFEEGLTDGVYSLSLVNDPAIAVEALKFNSDEKLEEVLSVKLESEDKRILVSPVLIPNQKIYRKSINGEEGYVYVTEDTIEKLQLNYFKHQYNHNSSLEHIHPVEGVFIFESWIIEDVENDKAFSLGFSNLPKGTWMIKMRIENEDLWNNYIRTGRITGISMDALLQPIKANNKQNNNINFSKQMKGLNFKNALKKAVAKRIAFQSDLMEVVISEEVSYFVQALEVGNTVFDIDGNVVADTEFEYEGVSYKTNEEGQLVEVEVVEEEIAFSEEDVEAIVEDIKEEIVVDYEATIAELKVQIAELEAELAIYKEAEAEEVELAKQSPAKRGIKTKFSKEVKATKSLLETVRRIK